MKISASNAFVISSVFVGAQHAAPHLGKIATAPTIFSRNAKNASLVGARHAVPALRTSAAIASQTTTTNTNNAEAFVVAQHAARLSATLTTDCPSTVNARSGSLR